VSFLRELQQEVGYDGILTGKVKINGRRCGSTIANFLRNPLLSNVFP